MTFEQISKDIIGRKFNPIYLLCGDEPHYIDKISELIISKVLSDEEKEFNQTILYGLDTDVLSVESEARKYPMMANQNLVVIREAQLLKDIELLENYAEKPVPTTILVLCYKKKIDKRKKFFKAISKQGIVFESNKLYENQIPDWIIKHLSHAGYQISMKNATLITDFLGNDLALISNELGKIILNLPEGTNITGEIIEQHVGISKEYNTFELNNALGHRNILKANRIIQYFGQNDKKYPLLLIVINLYAFFTKVMKLHFAQGKSSGEVASSIGVHPFFLKDYQLAIRNYDKHKLVDIFHLLHEYDLKAKGIGNNSISDSELMKEMVYKIMH
jgi:DNA polymerase-3 subunit delta